jgi:hypothetical protein
LLKDKLQRIWKEMAVTFPAIYFEGLEETMKNLTMICSGLRHPRSPQGNQRLKFL